MGRSTKLLLTLLLFVCVAFGIAYATGVLPHKTEMGEETETAVFPEETGAITVPETEIEPVEDLKEETLEEVHEDFVSGLAELRAEHDEDKEYVPSIVVNPEEASVIVGDAVQETVVAESDGEQVLDAGALEEAFEDTALVVPEGEQISIDELAEANDMEVSELDGGMVLLENAYQTCRIIVKQVPPEDGITDQEVLTDELALGVVGPMNGNYIFQYETPELAKEACDRWNQDDRVAYAEPEKVISTLTKKNENQTASGARVNGFSYKDYRYWGSAAVGFSHMKEVVKDTYGSVSDAPKVKVAVIDTGIDYNHPWFKNRLLSKGYDFVNDDKNATDDYMHGTACAGIIAKNTTKNVKILPLKAGDQNGSLTNADIYNALEYAIAKKVHIINMSFGCLNEDYSRLMKEGIDDAKDAGILLIAAYGNDGVKTVYHMPAGFAGVVGVSSVNVDKKLSYFSNYGKRVDISAPGEGIYCAVPKFFDDSRYCYLDGTSMSAPYVAAAAAMFKTLHPKYSASKITKLLNKHTLDLGKEGKDIRFGEGMIYLKRVKADS